MRRRLPRSTGAISGALMMLLGLWGALIPFVGPYFDYSFGTNSAWHYTSDRLWLCILPGAVAFAGGLLVVIAATRAAGGLGGWLALVGGAWFVIGPSVSLTWENGSGPIGRPLFGTTRQALELIGYFYGVGALLVALAAFAMGRFASRPHLVADRAVATRVGPARPTAPSSPAATPARPWGAGTPSPAAGSVPRADTQKPARRRLFGRKRETHEAEAARGSTVKR
jgi:hypothetical protein